MIVVLDVSAAIEIILKKDKKELYDSHYKTSNWVIAPDLFISEISNAFWKYYKAEILKHEECAQYIEDGLAMIDDFMEVKDLWKEAFAESIKNKHPVYDMFYAVLSRRNDATLLTNDRALSEICSKIGVSFFI